MTKSCGRRRTLLFSVTGLILFSVSAYLALAQFGSRIKVFDAGVPARANDQNNTDNAVQTQAKQVEPAKVTGLQGGHKDTGTLTISEKRDLVWPQCSGIPEWVKSPLKDLHTGEVVGYAQNGRLHKTRIEYEGEVSALDSGLIYIKYSEYNCKAEIINQSFGIHGVTVFENGEPAPLAMVYGCDSHTNSDLNGEFFLVSPQNSDCDVRAAYRTGTNYSKGPRVEVSRPEYGDVVDMQLIVPPKPPWGGTCEEARLQADLIPKRLSEENLEPILKIFMEDILSSLPECAFE